MILRGRFHTGLDTVVLFSKGHTEDKLRIIFDMCDNDRNGVIDKGELSEMLRSLVEIARTNNSLNDDQVTELIDGMFQSAGLEHKDALSYDDFKLMMREYRGDLIAIGLDCKGAKQNFLDTSTNVARMTSFHIDAVLLPSDVLKVTFYHPPNFKYLSGQQIRLSCTGVKPEEFHSFTLTSAPHENFLSCHIKAQGPWTWKLRNYFDPSNFNPKEMDPKIQLDGPFGGGNQDWYKFEVAVMVGGGIGVTPYASILNDLVFGTSTNRYSGVACKKVYFLWMPVAPPL
ncbi:hypothetical protein DAPPUDRAFT_263958 [Daphnia pulex]|uniref:NAD(P)H oxidase (H(2)O(2)-forming) n=1 Tax=Daphnia pulex TaxID=6669 RepID=E9HQN8_DAPPU|nr:hypothetical protein DAPPUDRAFT_263958 [Daphnia pulex]|eukprot:EFX65922.1 hypothetical protein DAPPUDRAFT_263958 [Daphnia pulex]